MELTRIAFSLLVLGVTVAAAKSKINTVLKSSRMIDGIADNAKKESNGLKKKVCFKCKSKT